MADKTSMMMKEIWLHKKAILLIIAMPVQMVKRNRCRVKYKPPKTFGK
jgi:hypothetical protein